MARWRPGANAVLAIASILFALLAVGGLEGALRVFGLGAPMPGQRSRLEYQHVRFPILAASTTPDGEHRLVPTDPRISFQSLAARKPAGGLRILVFGGSAAAGLGYSPNMTFASRLQVLLRLAEPERPVEVMNLGIVALSSQQVAAMVADACARYEPDLAIVYSGNNEFLEIHAEKYARLHGGIGARFRDGLMGSHLYRLARRGLGGGRVASLAEQNLSGTSMRIPERTLIRDIAMEPEEVDRIIAEYGENLEEIVAAARAANTTTLLMTVASNWRWRGREDLPAGWLREVHSDARLDESTSLTPALGVIDERLGEAGPKQRHEWLYRRALVEEARGEVAQAARDFRAATNEDPHLRRALDRMADAVRDVARGTELSSFDTIELLEATAHHGVVGFDEFYDYVHFTPRGALLVAGGLFRTLRAAGYSSEESEFDADAWVADRIAELNSLEEDPLSVNDWIGLGFDRERLGNRDLWKYDRLGRDLDEWIAQNPEDPRGLVYRGNLRFFELNGGKAAARDYEAALKIEPTLEEVQGSLMRLRRERAP